MKKILSLMLIAILVPAIFFGSMVLAVNTDTANSGITIQEEPAYTQPSYSIDGGPVYYLEGDCPFFGTELGNGKYKDVMNFYYHDLYAVTFKNPVAGTYHIQAFQHSAWWIEGSGYTASYGESENSTDPFELTIPQNCKSITFTLHLTGENKGYVTVGATMDTSAPQEFTVTYEGCCENMKKTVKYGEHFNQVIKPDEGCDIINAVAVMGKNTCIWPERKNDGSIEFDVPNVTGDMVIGVYMENREFPKVGCQAIQSITHNMEHVTFYDTNAGRDFFEPMTSLLPVFRLSVYPHIIAVMPDEGYRITSLKAVNRYYNHSNGEFTEVEQEVKKDENGCYLFSGIFNDNMNLVGVVEPIKGNENTNYSTSENITTSATQKSTIPGGAYVTYNLTNVISSNMQEEVWGYYETTLSPVSGYKINYISIKQGDKDMDVIDNGDGTYTFKNSGGFTHNLTITASAELMPSTYTHPIITFIEKITLSDEKLILNVGKTKKLKETVTPNDITTNTEVKWSSSNPTVATVDSNGKVTALKKGTATITVKAVEGLGAKAVCKVVVKQPVKSIRLNVKSKTLKVGQRLKIKAIAKPDTANDKYIKWKVKSKNVKLSCSKTKSGKYNVVTAKKAGKATITAKPNDGSKVSANCIIKVKKKH